MHKTTIQQNIPVKLEKVSLISKESDSIVPAAEMSGKFE
jgi:hypothetical protein